MNDLSLDRLASLHDSIVHQISYDATDAGAREVRISMTCPKKIGFAPWAGKHLILIAHDVLAMRHLVWTTADAERLNLITRTLSEEAKSQLRLLEHGNSRLVGNALTMVFHSGSSIEMICRDFAVQVGV